MKEYNEELLTESSVDKRKNNGLNSVRTLYIHLAKFVYQPYNQSASWCGSIFNAYKEANKYFNTNGVINAVTEDDKEKIWSQAIKNNIKRNRNSFKKFTTGLSILVTVS